MNTVHAKNWARKKENMRKNNEEYQNTIITTKNHI